MKTVAIIPARGGSKGMPRKNLARIGGQTLIHRCVKTCLSSRLLDEVIVSTDDEEIHNQASSAGGWAMSRPPDLATDDATSSDVLLYVLDQLDWRPDIVAFIQCTAPLLTAAEIDGTINRLIETNADVAIAAVENHEILIREGYADRVRGVGFDLETTPTLRQQRPKAYSIAGSVWAINAERFRKRRKIYSENCVIYQVSRKLDIDGGDDLKIAQLLIDSKTSFAYYPA